MTPGVVQYGSGEDWRQQSSKLGSMSLNLCVFLGRDHSAT